MSTRTSFRYSNAFKQKVIGEIESGVLSIAEASKIYEISLSGIYNWIKDFGKDHLIGKVVMVQKRDEVDKIKKLEAVIQYKSNMLLVWDQSPGLLSAQTVGRAT